MKKFGFWLRCVCTEKRLRRQRKASRGEAEIERNGRPADTGLKEYQCAFQKAGISLCESTAKDFNLGQNCNGTF